VREKYKAVSDHNESKWPPGTGLQRKMIEFVNYIFSDSRSVASTNKQRDKHSERNLKIPYNGYGFVKCSDKCIQIYSDHLK